LDLSLSIVSVIASSRIGSAGHVAARGEFRNACRILVGEARETPVHRLQENIKIYLRKAELKESNDLSSLRLNFNVFFEGGD
jgi:hypothetical protein